MDSASDQPSSEQRRFALSRRTASILITLLVHALLLMLLITLAPPRTFLPMGASRLISIAVSPENKEAARSKSETKAKQAKAKPQPAHAAAAPPPVPPPVPNQSASELPMIKLSHDELAQLDSALHAQHAEAGPSNAATGQADSEQAGKGPHGEQLYAAEWYREPTHAELVTYMPRGVVGWGDVACRTAPRFHVEDCVELAESPPGSHMSRAVREAAWQFLVRPPRIGGRLMVGEWVRIRITLTEEKVPQ